MKPRHIVVAVLAAVLLGTGSAYVWKKYSSDIEAPDIASENGASDPTVPAVNSASPPEVVQQDINDARGRVNAIWATARDAPAFGEAAKSSPSPGDIAAMSPDDLRSSALEAADATLAAVGVAGKTIRAETNAQTTPKALEMVRTKLQAAIDSLRSAHPTDVESVVKEVGSTIDQAQAIIKKSDGSTDYQSVLLRHVENAVVAMNVVDQVSELFVDTHLHSPNQKLITEKAGPKQSPATESWRGLVMEWLPLILMGLAALIAATYAIILHRSIKRLLSDNGKMARKIQRLELDLSESSRQVQIATKELNAAPSRTEIRRSGLKNIETEIAPGAEQGATLIPKKEAAPPPVPSKIPELKAELDAFLASGGKLRGTPYRDILSRFGSLHGLAISDGATVALLDDESTQQRHVTAVQMNGNNEVAIVPSAYFVSKFSMQFARELDLSDETKTFFNIKSGAAGSLSILRIGVGTLAGSSAVSNIRQGELTGFVQP